MPPARISSPPADREIRGNAVGFTAHFQLLQLFYVCTFGFYARLSSRLTAHSRPCYGRRGQWFRFVLGGCVNLYKGLLTQEKSIGKKRMKGDERCDKE